MNDSNLARVFKIFLLGRVQPVILTSDTRKIFVSNINVDESHSARVLIGCKPITGYSAKSLLHYGLGSSGKENYKHTSIIIICNC